MRRYFNVSNVFCFGNFVGLISGVRYVGNLFGISNLFGSLVVGFIISSYNIKVVVCDCTGMRALVVLMYYCAISCYNIKVVVCDCTGMRALVVLMYYCAISTLSGRRGPRYPSAKEADVIGVLSLCAIELG